MADASNTLSHEHVVSRRSAIKNAASGAVAVALPIAAALPAVAGDNDAHVVALETELKATREE